LNNAIQMLYVVRLDQRPFSVRRVGVFFEMTSPAFCNGRYCLDAIKSS
jgi:hypothetical protein